VSCSSDTSQLEQHRDALQHRLEQRAVSPSSDAGATAAADAAAAAMVEEMRTQVEATTQELLKTQRALMALQVCVSASL
jgi:predicted RecB family nuclease